MTFSRAYVAIGELTWPTKGLMLPIERRAYVACKKIKIQQRFLIILCPACFFIILCPACFTGLTMSPLCCFLINNEDCSFAPYSLSCNISL